MPDFPSDSAAGNKSSHLLDYDSLSQYVVLDLFTYLIAIIQSLYFVNRLDWLTRKPAVIGLFLKSIPGKILLPIC